MKHADVVVKSVIVGDNGKVLLLRRSGTDVRRPGGWDFAGGTVEDDEDFTAALAREIKEETGLEIAHSNLHLIHAQTDSPDGQRVLCYLIYIGHTSQTEISLSFEHDDYKWLTLSEAINLHEYPRQQKILKFIQDNRFLG